MTFDEFAKLHGLIPGDVTPGRWTRCPTTDKPRHRNGSFKHMGTYALVQNWATMAEPAVWRSEGTATQPQMRVQQLAKEAQRDAAVQARIAAHRAERILAECELATHPYLASKGFSKETANVWRRNAENLLVVPMKNGSRITGCQLISPKGDKRFLFGQRSGGAEFIFNARGPHFLCEGYATALSVRQALRNLKVPYSLHVTFSASNLRRVAQGLSCGYVLADNDASGTGERVAREIGWPFWISDLEGEDANDFCQRRGVFVLAMQIKQLMQKEKSSSGKNQGDDKYECEADDG